MKININNFNKYLKSKKRLRNIFLVLISALLSQLSYPEYDLFWVQFFSLIPFIYVIISEEKIINVVLYSILFSIVFKGILCYWAKAFHILAVPGMLVGFAVFFSIFGFWVKFLLIKFPKFKIFIIPGMWTVIEYIRSSGFLGFPWALTSHSQWNFLPFIQISDVFGMWIISFLVAFINTILLEILLNISKLIKNRKIGNNTSIKPLDKAKNHRDNHLLNRIFNKKWQFDPIPIKKIKIQFLVLVVVFIFPLIYGFIRIKHFTHRMQKSDELTIALIQPDIDPYLPWRKVKDKALSRLTILSARANLYEPALIAWPESGVQDYIKYYHDNADRLKKIPRFFESLRFTENVFRIPKDLNNYIFTGLPDYKRIIKANKKVVEKDYNSAMLINPDGKIADVYHKIKLVPFGEWFPYNIGCVKMILAQTWAGNWTPGKEYTIFKILKDKKEYRFAGLICYEGVFSDLCRKFALRGAEFFLNITNDAWSYTRKAELQHMIIAVFRAIENRLPYVRSANSGATAVINQYGKVISLLPLFKQGYLVNKIYIDKKKKFTIYTKYGDYFPKFLLIFHLLLLLYGLYKSVIRSVIGRETLRKN